MIALRGPSWVRFSGTRSVLFYYLGSIVDNSYMRTLGLFFYYLGSIVDDSYMWTFLCGSLRHWVCPFFYYLGSIIDDSYMPTFGVSKTCWFLRFCACQILWRGQEKYMADMLSPDEWDKVAGVRHPDLMWCYSLKVQHLVSFFTALWMLLHSSFRLRVMQIINIYWLLVWHCSR
jgi:hypothetical protein